jgi:hypothetical protein
MDEGRYKNRRFFAFSVEGNSGMDGAIWPDAAALPRIRATGARTARKIDRAGRIGEENFDIWAPFVIALWGHRCEGGLMGTISSPSCPHSPV